MDYVIWGSFYLLCPVYSAGSIDFYLLWFWLVLYIYFVSIFNDGNVSGGLYMCLQSAFSGQKRALGPWSWGYRQSEPRGVLLETHLECS